MTHTNDQGNVVDDATADSSECFSAEKTSGPRYVHPHSKALFAAVPFLDKIPVVGPTFEAFGPRCTGSLAGVYLLSKGVSKNIISFSIFPMFRKRYGVSAEVHQRMSGISSMGFSIKPLTAILSDAFAFFGYTKRWYMALSCVLTLACAIVYGILPSKASSAPIAAAMIFLSVFGIANIDVLSEGHFSRLIKKYPKPGAHLISWIWAFIMIGTIIAAAIQGPLSDAGYPQIGIFIAAGATGACVLFFIFNLYDEKKNTVDRLEDYEMEMKLLAAAANSSHPSSSSVDKPATMGVAADACSTEPGTYLDDATVVSDDSNNVTVVDHLWVPPKTYCGSAWEVNSAVVTENATVTFYGLLLTTCAIILTVLTIVSSTYQLLYGCIVISVVLCVSGFFLIPVDIMKASLFGWIQLCTYLSIPGALDNFFMADEACLPGGPAFSQTFYQTVGAVIGNVAGLGGVYLFAVIFSKRSYRLTCICTTIITVAAAVFDLIMVKRWNRPHMPDKALYILADGVVGQVIYMLNYMPTNILISRLCPKGCESTMFAILASFMNLGSSTSSTIGAILMETIWPVDVLSTPCDFSNVPALIISGHLISPLVCIPMAFLLLPGARMCDELDPSIVEATPIAQKWLNNWRSKKHSNDDSIDGDFTANSV